MQPRAWIEIGDTGRKTGSDQVALLAQARIAALQARADEALTLVARGGGGDYEKDFQANMSALIGSDGNKSGAAAKRPRPVFNSRRGS